MNKKGFTIVELIVTITILAILSFIAFISFNDYSQHARDSVRIRDIGRIEGSLNTFNISKGFFPESTSGVQINYEGSEAWTQGVFGKTSFDIVAVLNKLPVDPLSGNLYTYSISNKKNEFQLGAILESGIGYNKNILINSANAEGERVAKAYVRGNYNGQVLAVSTGSTVYLLAVPSIITSDISETNLLDIISSDLLVYNNYTNLPASYLNSDFKVVGEFDYNPNEGLVTYSGAAETFYNQLQDEGIRVEITDSIKETYNGTVVPPDESNLGLLLATEIDTDDPSSDAKLVACQTIDYILNTKLSQNGCKSSSFVFNYFSLGGGLSGDDKIYDHKIDSSGNSYIVGTYEGAGSFFGESLSASGTDMFAMKLNNIGEVQWVQDISSDGIEPENIDLDTNGNLYIVGGFLGTGELMGNTVVSNGDEDYYLLKITSGGGFGLLKSGGGTGSDRAKGIALDASGNIFVAGHFSTSTNIFSEPLTNAGGNYEGFIAKLDSAGNNSGAAYWVKSSGASGEWISHIVEDGSGNSYVSGAFSSSNATVFGFPVVGEGSYDMYVAKFNSSGNAQWVETAGGTGYEETDIIKVSSDGSIYSAGYFGAAGASTIFGTGVTAGSPEDAYIAKLNPDGSVDSFMHADTSGIDRISDFSINPDNNIVLIYRINSTQTIFGETLDSGRYLVTLDSSMSYTLVIDAINGGIEENRLNIDSDGDYYINGKYNGGGHSIDGESLQPFGGDDIYITKLNSSGKLDN